MIVKILYFCLSVFVLQTAVWCTDYLGTAEDDRSGPSSPAHPLDFWAQLKGNIGTLANPDLARHFQVIIDAYKNARVTSDVCDDEEINKCLDFGDSKAIFIQALHTIANSYKDTDPNAECRDLFRYLYITASAVFRELDEVRYEHQDFLDKLKHYFSEPSASDSCYLKDYTLESNFKTFMACQFYLSWLLTNPGDRNRASFTIDRFSEDLPLYIDPISYIIHCLSTYGTPYYRHVLSPVEGMARLFPDYVPLVIPISLTAEDIFNNLPNETNRLWFVGLALSEVEADGSLMTPLQFFLHDLFHLIVYMLKTHYFVISLVTKDESVLLHHSGKTDGPKSGREYWAELIRVYKKALNEQDRLTKEWVKEAEEDEKALRSFVAFYTLHELLGNLSFKDIFNSTGKIMRSMGIELHRFRNDRFYRKLLPGCMQDILNVDLNAAASDGEREIVDNIEEKIKELYYYIRERNELEPHEKEEVNYKLGKDFFHSKYFDRFPGDEFIDDYAEDSHDLGSMLCIFDSRGFLVQVLKNKKRNLIDREITYLQSLRMPGREAHPPAVGAGAGAGGHK